jgi:hypothetical protein
MGPLVSAVNHNACCITDTHSPTQILQYEHNKQYFNTSIHIKLLHVLPRSVRHEASKIM